MPYRLALKPGARRDLDRLPADLFARVDARILSEDPRPPGAGKLRGTRNGFRVRVGDHRILYEVDDATRTVTIARVRHRREVYRDL